MKTFESATHVGVPTSNGVVDIYKKEKSKIIDTKISKEGIEEVVYTSDNAPNALVDILKAFDQTPVLRMAHNKGNIYHVDYEVTGDYKKFRWIGVKTKESVEQILTEYSFDHRQILAMFSACDRVEHETMKEVL